MENDKMENDQIEDDWLEKERELAEQAGQKIEEVLNGKLSEGKITVVVNYRFSLFYIEITFSHAGSYAQTETTLGGYRMKHEGWYDDILALLIRTWGIEYFMKNA
jgi:hypothetical protein